MKEIALMAVAVAGCAEPQGTAPQPGTTPQPGRTLLPGSGLLPSGPGGGSQIDSCGLGSIKDMVGKAMTETMADEAGKRSGARTVRVIRPGMMVTMDFREDRLNIEVDDKGIVTNLRCG